jgi:hypothetical protein
MSFDGLAAARSKARQSSRMMQEEIQLEEGQDVDQEEAHGQEAQGLHQEGQEAPGLS